MNGTWKDNCNPQIVLDELEISALNSDLLVRGTEKFSRILATEGLTIEHDEKLDTAEFDVVTRTIRLPIMEGMTPEVYEGYLSHEVGHALYSPNGKDLKAMGKELEAKGVPFYYFNVTEDARIEKLLKRRFPGMVRSFGMHYRALREDLNLFKHPLGLPVSEWDLVDRINYRMKMGESVPVPFTQEEQKFVDVLLSVDCETAEDAARIAEEIFLFAKQRSSNNNGDMKFGGADASGCYRVTKNKNDDSPPKKELGSQPKQSGAKNQDEADESGADQSNQGAKEQENKENGGNPSSDVNGAQNESPEADGDDGEEAEDGPGADSNFHPKDNLDKNTGWSDSAVHKGINRNNKPKGGKDGGATHSNGVTSVAFAPEIPWTDWIANENGRELVIQGDKVSNILLDFEKETGPTVSLMAQVFQQKASARNYARSAIAKTGQLDMRLLSKYKFTDDLFKKVAVTPNQKNHGYVMIIDWSSSMSNVAVNAILQASLMVRFWERIAAPFDVYLFTDGGSTYGKQNINHGLLPDKNFQFFHISSSKWKAKENKGHLSWAIGRGRNSMSYTPLEDSLVVARYVLEDFITANRLDKTTLILLTDGDGNGPPQYFTKGNKAFIFANKPGFIFDKKTGTNIRIPSSLSSRLDGRRFLVALKAIFGEQLTIIGFFIDSNSDNFHLENRMAVKGKDIHLDPNGMVRWTAKGIGYDKFFVVPSSAFSSGKTSSRGTSSDVPVTSDQRIAAIAKEAMRRPSQKLSVMAKEFIASTA